MDKQNKLKLLKQKMTNDLSLPLRDSATNLVFGEGDPDSEVVFIGEGPGYWEDVKGRPFVGSAGALLNQLLALVDIKREAVFITNVVHYRPPDNRDPEPQELAAFRPYLDGIIEIISPKMIVTLGRFSMGKFLPGVLISKVHGRLHKVLWRGNNLAILPMYHPAAALRNGEIKRRLFEDFKKIPDYLIELKKDRDRSAKNDAEQMQLI